MQSNQPEALTDFYKSWINWVHAGCPFLKPYHTSWGLCRCLAEALGTTEGNLHEYDIYTHMARDFRMETGKTSYPFNDGSMTSFRFDIINHSMPHNKKRLAFVKAHIPDYVEPMKEGIRTDEPKRVA